MDLYIYEFGPNSKDYLHAGAEDIFEIFTCQRTVVVSKIALMNGNALRSFEGAQAYEYLLRFACGLESEIKGETDVFGQLKQAFKEFTDTDPASAVHFKSLLARIFEDTKEVRANYLHGIGGTSYGALARRLLNPTPKDNVLLLGAGQISKSIAPYFTDSKLTVYNRSVGRLLELTTELKAKGYSRIDYIQDDVRLEDAFRAATLVLVCTPPGSALDAQVIEGSRKNPQIKIFHFGAQSPDLAPFRDAAHLEGRVFSLTELFEMEKAQCSFRDRQVAQALEACRHRAILRSMSRSIHIAHGWEDLPAFY
jgi:glutamyl-tRNA reductase